MLDRHFVESFLKINNMNLSASDDRIREVFVIAGWEPEEVQRAMLLIRDRSTDIKTITPNDPSTQLSTQHASRTSADLSMLLGIDVVVDPISVRAVQSNHATPLEFFKKLLLYTIVIVFATIFAVIMGMAFMYYMHIGPFYSPV